jgi:Tol biopolymer transport system component
MKPDPLMTGYMLKIQFFLWGLVFAWAISGCSVEVNQPPVAVSPIASTQNPNESPAPAKVPVTWANLNLTGKLVYIAANNTTARVSVQSLDLETGDIVTIFQVPQLGWVDAVAVSPDHKTMILSYSPPPSTPYAGQTSLYRMSLDASETPQLLITPSNGEEQYSQPTWSPDGKYIYFAHINYETMTSYEIMRMAYPDGKPEKLVDHAYWPRASEDDTLLVYVALDPQSGKNQLSFANADGTDPNQVPLNGLPVPYIIDTPMFSPDNQSILFSSPLGIKASAPNWFDKVLGVQVALANGSLPSDWWSVPIAGGTPTQLTNIQTLSLFGTFSPDKKHIASYSLNGIFVMNPDGTEITIVVNDVGGIPGTVSWIP